MVYIAKVTHVCFVNTIRRRCNNFKYKSEALLDQIFFLDCFLFSFCKITDFLITYYKINLQFFYGSKRFTSIT